jgi:hypothetical protein
MKNWTFGEWLVGFLEVGALVSGHIVFNKTGDVQVFIPVMLFMSTVGLGFMISKSFP